MLWINPIPVRFGFVSGVGHARWLSALESTRYRISEVFTRFLGKLRIYSIGRQDNSADWLLENYPSLFVILSENNYKGMFWTRLVPIRRYLTWNGPTKTFVRDTALWAKPTHGADGITRRQEYGRETHLRTCIWLAPYAV